MITIKCTAPEKVLLSTLIPFQGDLKKRTDEEVQALADSITEEGLLMPFAVWRNDGNNYLLDGHGRLAALTLLSVADDTISKQKLPAVFVEAETEDEAKKALLQITSSYGKITKKGAVKFTASIPEYHAPSIDKFVHKKVVHRKTASKPSGVMIRICVPEDKETAVREILAKVNYITVL